IPVSGNIQNNTFSNNIGISIFDDDRTNGPINEVQYNNNKFYETIYDDDVIYGGLIPKSDVAALNTMVVNRDNGTSTVKSHQDNIALTSAPVIVDYILTPQTIPQDGADQNPDSVVNAYLTLIWQASGASLDTITLSEPVYVTQLESATTKTLMVEAEKFMITLNEDLLPAAEFQLEISDGRKSLHWVVRSCDFLVAAIDNGTGLETTAIEGEIYIPDSVLDYRFFAVTKQGGFVASESTNQPVLDVLTKFYILVKQDATSVTQQITVRNSGGSILTWSTSVLEDSTIHILSPISETEGDGVLSYNVDVSDKLYGEYNDYITIDAQDAGSQSLEVTIMVVEDMYNIFTPMVTR
ncbi:MAG: hypothetical protein P1S60_03070, partial [Anaerolineae bacterium]|nr:hypothetical protein [Anaerolineae bacterium]